MLRCSKIGFRLIVLVLSVLPVAAAQADVRHMPPGSTSLELVPVGNPGNSPDTRYNGISVGEVDYAYAIGKYDITAGQYCEFLNAVAAIDAYGLYNQSMRYTDSATRGCNIQRSGTSGSYAYSVAADWANRPVNYVSWGDAARFCNWLQNGQPTGPQGLSTTEDGVYYLNGATTEAALMAVTRKPNATWFLPSEDEWYKAAYYDPIKLGGRGYWDFPTRSNDPPSNVLSATGTNNANYRPDLLAAYTIGYPYYRTEVGAFAGSPGPYGTFDQGGNVFQWIDTAIYGSTRGVFGGSFPNPVSLLGASGYRHVYWPTGEFSDDGFRVASIAFPADANLDGTVDVGDLSVVLTNFDKSGMTWSQGDFDSNGTVDIADLAKLLTNYDKSVGASAGGIKAVPEPSAVMLLLGSIVGRLVWRRWQ
jgi:formylglycine-generating enzyme